MNCDLPLGARVVSLLAYQRGSACARFGAPETPRRSGRTARNRCQRASLWGAIGDYSRTQARLTAKPSRSPRSRSPAGRSGAPGVCRGRGPARSRDRCPRRRTWGSKRDADRARSSCRNCGCRTSAETEPDGGPNDGVSVVEHGTEADGEGPVERKVVGVRDEPRPEAAPQDEVGALPGIQRPHPQPEVVAARGEAEEPSTPRSDPSGRGEAQAELVVSEGPVGCREDRGTGLLRLGGESPARGLPLRRKAKVEASLIPQ